MQTERVPTCCNAQCLGDLYQSRAETIKVLSVWRLYTSFTILTLGSKLLQSRPEATENSPSTWVLTHVTETVVSIHCNISLTKAILSLFHKVPRIPVFSQPIHFKSNNELSQAKPPPVAPLTCTWSCATLWILQKTRGFLEIGVKPSSKHSAFGLGHVTYWGPFVYILCIQYSVINIPKFFFSARDLVIISLIQHEQVVEIGIVFRFKGVIFCKCTF